MKCLVIKTVMKDVNRRPLTKDNNATKELPLNAGLNKNLLIKTVNILKHQDRKEESMKGKTQNLK